MSQFNVPWQKIVRAWPNDKEGFVSHAQCGSTVISTVHTTITTLSALRLTLLHNGTNAFNGQRQPIQKLLSCYRYLRVLQNFQII